MTIRGGKEVAKKAYEEAKKKFRKIWFDPKFKREFGFTPSNYKLTAEQISEYDKKTYFRCLIDALGRDFWAMRFIRIGLWVSELSDKGERTIIDKIRIEIRKNKGPKASTVVKMGSTGAIRGVIDYIERLSMESYSKESLREEFEKIVDEWRSITIFVKKDGKKELIKEMIKSKISRRYPLFFIFSYGADANQIATFSIAELRNEDELESKDYIWDTYPHFDGVGVKVFMWTFKLCESEEERY